MNNLEQLKMLVLAADLGSFSACARKMGKVQSAISQGINNLEIDLDILLFDRSTRKPALTEEGQRIYNCAKAVLQQSLELEKVAESIHNKEEALIRVAIDKAIQTPKLWQIIKRFSQSFPQTQIELMSVSSTDIIDKFEVGGVDLGIMFADPSFKREVELCFVGSLEFVAVSHPTNPLAQIELVKDSDLTPYRQLLIRGEQGGGLQPFMSVSHQTWWCNDFDSVISLVEQNIGWAYLPYYMVEEKIKQQSLAHLSLSFDHKPWCLPIDLVTAKGVSKGPALSWLFNELKSLID